MSEHVTAVDFLWVFPMNCPWVSRIFLHLGKREIGMGTQILRAPCMTDKLRFKFLLRPALLLGSSHSQSSNFSTIAWVNNIYANSRWLGTKETLPHHLCSKLSIQLTSLIILIASLTLPSLRAHIASLRLMYTETFVSLPEGKKNI